MNDDKTFAILDSAVIPLLTQPMQHLLFQQYTKENELSLVFYLTEDKLTLKKMHTLNIMLPDLQGKINNLLFMRLGQLIGKNKLGIGYIKMLVENGYKLHFIREQIKIKNLTDFSNQIYDLNIFQMVDSVTQEIIEDNILSTF